MSHSRNIIITVADSLVKMGAAESSLLSEVLEPDDVPDTVDKLKSATIRTKSDLELLKMNGWSSASVWACGSGCSKSWV